VSWDADTDVAKLRMPAHCLAGGEYGAVRFALLTELTDDTDYAPETAGGSITSTDWVPRG
jgi:hypothetical protein